MITECGVSDENQNSKPKVIKPHPNFRLFLSMNPSSHEISRAMRNRCVEVCVLPPTVSNPVSNVLSTNDTGLYTIDAFTALWDSEVRSHNVGHCMVTSHHTEFQKSIELQEETRPIKALKEWGACLLDY